MPKRYHWLKLKEDFFDAEEIRLIEEMDNGKDYVIFLLKLRLKSINTNGYLYFKNLMPYDDKMLATITNTNIDIVRSALKVFTELGMISKKENGEIYMEQIQDLIGNEGESAERMRRLRERERMKSLPPASQCDGDVQKSDIDIDIDIDIEKDIDKEKDKKIRQVMDAYNHIFKDLWSKALKLTKERRAHISQRLNTFTVDELITAIKNVRDSEFHCGKNDRNWKATPEFIFRNDTQVDKWLAERKEGQSEDRPFKYLLQRDEDL